MRRIFFVAGLALASIPLGCTQPPASPPKLAAVAPLPKPSLPPWIESVSPLAKAQSLAQIRVIFAKPVTNVESLEGDGPRSVLSHVRFEPALKGRFVVLTPRMIGFVADEALPTATRVQVTVTAGLRDVAGDTLDHDVSWTFETSPLEFSHLPTARVPDSQSTPPPVDLHPKLRVDANAPVDVASLADKARLSGPNGDVPVNVNLVPTPSPLPGAAVPEEFDPSHQTWTYELQPRSPLLRATEYALKIDPGVEPQTGNMATSGGFSGDVRTFGALLVVATPAPAPGRFAGGDPVVMFDNPIDPKTIDGNVTISPRVSPAPRVVPYTPVDATVGISVDPYALDPNHDYTITIGTGLKDIFGQSLQSAQTVAVHTGRFAPGIWAPSGSTVVPADANVELNFYATNLPEDRYRATFVAMTPQQLITQDSPVAILPSPAASWPLETLRNAAVDKQSVVRIPVRERLHARYGALGYGFFAQIGAQDGTTSSGLVQLTNLGIFGQWFPGHGVVMIQHLSDGAPVARASIELYRADPNGVAAPQSCASGVTDAAGEYDVRGVDLERCYAGARLDGAPAIGVVAREGADVATLRTGAWSGIYRYDVPGGWVGGAPLARGVIFSDRQMYQPGERAQLTGIAYYVKGSVVRADKNAAYSVVVQDPSNAIAQRAAVVTDRYGIFTLPLALSKTEALGYYTITATGSNGNVIAGSMRVAQFKPPNFKMSVSLSAASATSGNGVTASAKAAYLFGSPLQGGKAHAIVTRSFAQVAPHGWDDFTFGRQWFWPEQQP
ncbi:MAG: Ig-like domain-containing protein, partial [Candidatus Eremiobacteraeota bacterium]|nr:Ig-like domain-containing protein [Candidatus Eremiobacteraeota bacterium]